MSPEREVLTWAAFGPASRELAQRVADAGFRPTLVVAVARGGLTLAGALGYALGVKRSDAINVEFYTDVETTLPDPVVLAPALDLASLAGERVLVADDVADSGRTLDLVVRIIADAGAEVRSAVLYTKPGSVITPDWSWREVDRWIDFPWSDQPPVVADPVGLGH